MHRRILTIFLLGFSSGLPFLLTLSTLAVRLKEAGISTGTIGLFALATLPYPLKFLWGPLVDKITIPFLTSYLGPRRDWAVVSQLALIVMLIGLGSSQPEMNLMATACWAFGVAFFSALQDTAIEAYRIEIAGEQHKGKAASAVVLGWRCGMMTAGAGTLLLAEAYTWSFAYNAMALLLVLGLLATLLSPSFTASRPCASLRISFGEFWKSHDWRYVLTIIFLYKLGDTFLNVMTIPFLLDAGYEKTEIAEVASLFGVFAMIAGGFTGGLLVDRLGIIRALVCCAALQCVSCLLFFGQANAGHNLPLLILTVGMENFTSGLGATVLISYFSSLCRSPHTATQFAFLSSFGSLARIGLSMTAGFVAEALAWPLFFMATAVACLPCLLLSAQAYKARQKIQI